MYALINTANSTTKLKESLRIVCNSTHGYYFEHTLVVCKML